MKLRANVEVIPVKGTTDLPEDHCPFCGAMINAASSIDHDHLPSPGYPSICCMCGEIMTFGEKLRLRKPTEQDMANYRADPCWEEMQKQQARFKKLKLTAFGLDFRKPEKPQ